MIKNRANKICLGENDTVTGGGTLGIWSHPSGKSKHLVILEEGGEMGWIPNTYHSHLPIQEKHMRLPR